MKKLVPRRPTQLTFAPVTDLVAQAPPEPGWLLEGYVAQGSLTLLAGPPKVGKSTLVAALLSALQDGRSFIGQKTRESGALVLTEERLDGLAEKARRFGLDDRVHALTRNESRGVSWEQLVEQAVAHAEQERLSLLVVDTFAEFAGLEGEQENNAGSVKAALRPLQIAADKGLAVLIVTHTRKSGGKHGSAVRGSTAFTAAVDVVTELSRGRGENVRVLDAESRYSATPKQRILELTGDEFVTRCETTDERDEEKILDALALGAMTEADLITKTEIPRSTLRRRLKPMIEAGRIVAAGGATKSDPRVLSLATA